jgi:hypothetical protein
LKNTVIIGCDIDVTSSALRLEGGNHRRGLPAN